MAGPASIAGLSSPRLAMLVRALLSPRNQPQQGMPAYQQPFTGLRNEPMTLPAFQQPGQELAQYQPPMQVPQQQQSVMPQQQQPVMAQMPQTMAPAAVPPMPEPTPVRSDVMAAIQQLAQAGKLPEQWKGAFQPQYGEPL